MLFVSHASQDRAAIDRLLAVLRRADQQVWLDDELAGGEAWWETILKNIRGCGVFIVALSNNSLASKPCQAELRYAQALRRPIFPVRIGPIDSVRVTPLAATQVLDYRNPTEDIDTQVIAAVQNQREQAGPLPSPLPEAPEVPFAYLMRLATTLSTPELGPSEQAQLVSELRNRLDEDYHDPSARRDIIQLMYLLRDRPDVTWRTRNDIDTLLAANDTALSTPAGGLATVPFSGLQPVKAPPAMRAKPVAVTARGSNAADAGRTRRSRTKWLIGGGVGVAVIGGVLAAAVLTRPGLDQADSILLDDADIGAIMGASDMETVESGINEAKDSSTVEVSSADCAGVLYPGLDRTYPSSDDEHLSWKVVEKPGGLQRAGVGNNRFVDQDVATFSPNTDRPGAFVAASAKQWKSCAGQTVTATYPDHSKYVWTVGDLTGEAPLITQTFALAGDQGYTCQRVLNAVSDAVIDVKACGVGITNEASRITGKLVAGVTKVPAF
jgi:hypothetical protein